MLVTAELCEEGRKYDRQLPTARRSPQIRQATAAGDTQTQGQSAECFPVPLPERDDCLDLAVKPQSSISSNHYSDVRCACSVCVCVRARFTLLSVNFELDCYQSETSVRVGRG